MTQDNWNFFPRLIEHKINNLLAQAEPNNAKAYQLYKTCKNENLWRNSFELFTVHLSDYFSLPEVDRVKSYFDKFLDRPMNRIVYDGFHLTFRTAHIDAQRLLEVADWSHTIIKNSCELNSVIISADVFKKTLSYITAPPSYEKDQDIEFEDFCIAWKKTVSRQFGKKHDVELEKILKKIRLLNEVLKRPELQHKKKSFIPGIYLTQTEIDWVLSVRNSTLNYKSLPKFPLMRGPEKEKLIQLERAALLYNIIRVSARPELIQQLENVRSTILNQCDWLLNDKMANSA